MAPKRPYSVFGHPYPTRASASAPRLSWKERNAYSNSGRLQKAPTAHAQPNQGIFPMIEIPPLIQQAIAAGAALYLSISGGKDSQALINQLGHLANRGLIHMDLGRAEWPQTPAFVEHLARQSGLPLTLVRRPQGDLVDDIAHRLAKLSGTAKPFWPSAAQRYCTAHHKRNQADKLYRQHQLIISAEGNRAQESPKRAKDQPLSIRQSITAKHLRHLSPAAALAQWLATRQGRLALTWYPLHNWSIDQVWQACGTSQTDLTHRRALYQAGQTTAALAGWPCHPAYVFGNQRLSCALCVLASENDLRNGAQHHPQLAQIYLSWEQQTGITFKSGRALSAILNNSPLG